MKISIEITTYNRQDELLRVLEQLARQTCPADQFEVIISDDGSTDGLRDVETQVRQLPFATKILRHQHQGPGHAHNCGIHACQAPIILMLAADILPSPELVEQHLLSHLQHPAEEVVVVGRLIQSTETPRTALQRSFDHELNQLFESKLQGFEHGGFLVSNLSFKRDYMLREGMFKPWPPAAGEDLELGYRLKQKGMELIRNPLALGYHYHPATVDSLARRAYLTGYHRHFFVDHVPELWVRKWLGTVRLSDGWLIYLRNAIKKGLRRLFLNPLSMHGLVIPFLRQAELRPLPLPLVGGLTRCLASYYVRRGMRDYQNKTPL